MKLVVHQNFGNETPKKAELEYLHKHDYNYSRPYTVIINNLPTREELLDMAPIIAEGEGVLPLQIGVSVVHPSDMFVKKVGLEIAEANIGVELFQIGHFAIWHKDNKKRMNIQLQLVDKPELGFYLEYMETGRPTTEDRRSLGAVAYELAGIYNKPSRRR